MTIIRNECDFVILRMLKSILLEEDKKYETLVNCDNLNDCESTSCHQCGITSCGLVRCTDGECGMSFCRPCLCRFYKFSKKAAKLLPTKTWKCPKCTLKCTCLKYI